MYALGGRTGQDLETVDLNAVDVRALNQRLQRRSGNEPETAFEVLNPMGRHSLAAGLMHTIDVRIRGHAGYYCAGMNEGADIVVGGSVGHMSAFMAQAGRLVVCGDAGANLGDSIYEADYAALGTRPGACDKWQTGMCPVGIATQRPELEARLDPEEGARRVRNYLSVLTMECRTLARACGKSHVHNLEPEDMVALTVEAAAMAQVPLAGTNLIPGRS